MIRKTLHEIWPYLALAACAAAFPLVVRSTYVQFVGATIGLYAIMSLGLCLLLGYAGQASLGHAAFYGLGAYTSAILTTRYHTNPWLAMGAGIALTSAVAVVIGRPALKLHGHYLAMATLGFGVIVQIIFHEGGDFTGGFGGIAAIPPLRFGSLAIKGDTLNFLLIWALTILALAISANVVHSRVGRALRAIHDSEVAAQACGIDVSRFKLMVFVLSAMFASVAGSLYAHYIGFISPDPFGLTFSVQLIVFVIVGGSRSVWGALLGAALMTIVGQQIERYEAIKDLNTVMYGLMMILFVIFMPAGLADVIRRATDRIGRKGVVVDG
ncbi:MAG: branched-chain amino acid ABC transporter permease [Armatimonadetes bacterium]|nr:branched-chain amino acid ABC transporter permease [Armatimonadota bacterium]